MTDTDTDIIGYLREWLQTPMWISGAGERILVQDDHTYALHKNLLGKVLENATTKHDTVTLTDTRGEIQADVELLRAYLAAL